MFPNASTSRQSSDGRLFPQVPASRQSYDGSEKIATIENQLSKHLPANESLSYKILLDSLAPNYKLATCKMYEPSCAFDYIKYEGLPTKSGAIKEDGNPYKISNWAEVPTIDSEMVVALMSLRSMVIDLFCGEEFDKLKGQRIYRGPSKDENKDYLYRQSVVVTGYDTIQRGEEICWRVKNSKGTCGDKGYGNVIFQSQMPPDSVHFIQRAYVPTMFY